MVLTKKFTYVQRVEGEPKETDFSLIEYDLPVALNNGGLLKNKFRFIVERSI